MVMIIDKSYSQKHFSFNQTVRYRPEMPRITRSIHIISLNPHMPFRNLSIHPQRRNKETNQNNTNKATQNFKFRVMITKFRSVNPYHSRLIPIGIGRVRKEIDLITLHAHNALRQSLPRVQRGANQHHVAGANPAHSVRHVLGQKDIAGQIQGREHARAVHLQPQDTEARRLYQSGKLKKIKGSRGRGRSTDESGRTKIVVGNVKQAEELGYNGCAIDRLLHYASPLSHGSSLTL